MDNMQLISIWEASRSAGRQIHAHSHNYTELVYYTHGSGTSTFGGRCCSFSGGTFALIGPGVSHWEQHLTDSGVICLEFSGDASLPQSFGADPLGEILRVLRQILSEVKHQKPGYQQMTRLKLSELCLLLQRADMGSAGEKSFEYIINYLKENYHERILLSHCAAQLNLSYDYFQHRFKALTGMSPQRFLIRQRLDAARMLLCRGNISCTQIAYRCGFSTSAQFSALFKREYGISPARFQKEKTCDEG